MRAWTYVSRNIGKSVFDLLGGNPGRPFFLASDPGDARPGERLFADRDAVANGLALRKDIVEVPIIRIDHDGAGQLLAPIVDDVPLVFSGNARLGVGRIGQQLPVPRRPIGLRSRRERPLHATTERPGGQTEEN